MSHKYNQYYNHQKPENQPVSNPEETVEQELDVTTNLEDQTQDVENEILDTENVQQPEDEAPAELLEGNVTNCIKLNIRKEPNLKAPILCEVALNAVLAIDSEKSNNEWLHVFTDTGIDGFCMAKYVNIKQ